MSQTPRAAGSGRGPRSNGIEPVSENEGREPNRDYSEDAEQAVLSAMLMDSRAISLARELVDPAMLGQARHAQIFRAILSLADRGDVVDPLTLSAELEAAGSLEASGGKDYIGFLVDAVPTAANVEYHAKIVRRMALARRVKEISEHSQAMLGAGTAGMETAAWQTQALSEAMDRYGDRARRRIALLNDRELENLASPPDLIERRIPGRVISQIFGPSGNGKTFVALDIACHVAIGLPWNGSLVEQGRVVYVVGEGIYGMKRRVAAWKKAHGVSTSIQLHFLPVGIPIAANSPALAELLTEIGKLPSPPALIVLDTVSRNFPGGSQSDDEAMNRFVDGCHLLKDRAGGTVLAVHHTGWTELERSRGSSAWPAALDTEIRCDREGERLTLTWTKQRDDEPPPPIYFEMIKSGPSLALKTMDQSGGKLDGNRLICLSAIHRMQGGATHGTWMKEAGLEKKRSSFNQTLDWLVAQSYVSHTGKKYEITDAGRLALGPLVHRRSTDSPSSPVLSQSITPGSSKTPAMDKDRRSDNPQYLSPEEELEYLAEQRALKGFA